jgi:hypothetical protein
MQLYQAVLSPRSGSSRAPVPPPRWPSGLQYRAGVMEVTRRYAVTGGTGNVAGGFGPTWAQAQSPRDRALEILRERYARGEINLLGGRVAEELVFGDVPTGAQDDLQRATDMARHMVARYGMSEALGLATFEGPVQFLFLNVPSLAQREYSEETARRIDAEIEQLLSRAHERVQQTLGVKRATLEALAKCLIEREVVDRAALTELIADTESAPQSRMLERRLRPGQPSTEVPKGHGY